MLCLSCETEVPYRSEVCSGCGQDLRAPEHGYGDHCTQVQRAVEGVLAGQLTLEEALPVYQTFCALIEEFYQAWNLEPETLTERLPPHLVKLLPAFSTVSGGLVTLEKALNLYDSGFENCDHQALAQGNVELEAFFRACCAGLAQAERALT